LAQIIAEDKPGRLLIVEGADEVTFFKALCEFLDIGHLIQIEDYKGKDRLRLFLANLVEDSTSFDRLAHLGIVRDAGYNTNAFDSIRSALRHANTKNVLNQLPIPEKNFVPFGNQLKVSTLILPDDALEGTLENVVLESFKEDSIIACVNAYFACLTSNGLALTENVLPKATMRVFLAGKSVVTGDTRWWITDIYTQDWWSWDSPAFDSIKLFLRQMITD